MAKNVTLADIAEEVGVSVVAVSKALSGKPGVSEKLRDKIKSVAEKKGYVHTISSPKKERITGNIGVVVPEQYYGYTISFYGQLYKKVVKALYQNDYYGILELLSPDDEKCGNLPRIIQDNKVDGIIVLGGIEKDYIKKMIQDIQLPILFLDHYVSSLEFDAVISDGYYGMYELTDYLIRQGHKRIGFVGSVDATSSISDRFFGYQKALRENHISFQQEWEIPDRDASGISYERIPFGNTVLDAYVCNCDFTAYRLAQNLEAEGFRVPEDVSVVGFDNFVPIGMNMDPDWITTYEVNMDQMAQTGVQTLLQKIRREKYIQGVQIVTGKMLLKKTVKKRLP